MTVLPPGSFLGVFVRGFTVSGFLSGVRVSGRAFLSGRVTAPGLLLSLGVGSSTGIVESGVCVGVLSPKILFCLNLGSTGLSSFRSPTPGRVVPSRWVLGLSLTKIFESRFFALGSKSGNTGLLSITGDVFILLDTSRLPTRPGAVDLPKLFLSTTIIPLSGIWSLRRSILGLRRS